MFVYSINPSGEHNELVYFLVTNVEHSVPSRLGDVSSPDMYVGATVGELGCWVDPSATRMVQTGIEHSRVPDMARYLSISMSHTEIGLGNPISRSNTAQRVLPPEDVIPDQDTAFGKLLALASAALNRRAVDYHLQLSILLQGPRGCGKATTATWVAQRLGIHLLEVVYHYIFGFHIFADRQ